MHIRRLQSNDAPAFQEVRLAALLESPTSFGSSHDEEKNRELSNVAEFISGSDQRVFFGAFEENSLIGIIGLGRETGKKEGHKGFIRSMYVAPKARGLGVGKALMQHAIDLAASWPGLRQITLTVTAGNQAAICLYRQMGFQEYGREPKALLIDGEYYDEILMVKLENAA